MIWGRPTFCQSSAVTRRPFRVRRLSARRRVCVAIPLDDKTYPHPIRALMPRPRPLLRVSAGHCPTCGRKRSEMPKFRPYHRHLRRCCMRRRRQLMLRPTRVCAFYLVPHSSRTASTNRAPSLYQASPVALYVAYNTLWYHLPRFGRGNMPP